MRTELNNIEKIERYLMNEMSAEERNAFEQAMKKDPELQKKVEQQEQIMEGTKRIGLKKNISKGYKSYRFKNNFLKWGIIAAIPLATAVAFYSLNKNSSSATPPVSGYDSKYGLPELNENGDTLWADADKYLPFQFYSINNEKDTVIETDDGIIFSIAANSFLDENGKPVKGDIQLEIKEALTPDEIIKGGLSTRSEDRDLETAGMFYLNARQNNQSLKIDPEKGILANIPTDEIKADMQLFEGKRKADGNIDWVNPKLMEKFLTTIDIMSLNFYPPGYEDTLISLGKNVDSRTYKDSLYYSFDVEPAIFIQRYGDIPEHITLDMAIALGYTEIPKNKITEEEAWLLAQKGLINNFFRNTLKTTSYHSHGGISPQKVKSFWNLKFNNTMLATKEFEERMHAIHNNCNEAVLNLYLNNLDKNLCTTDSMAAQMMGGNNVFAEFAARGDGKVNIEDSRCKQLSRYVDEKTKIYQQALEKTRSEYYKKNAEDNQRAIQKNTAHSNQEFERYVDNFVDELKLNLDDAYHQLGKKNPKRVIVTRQPLPYYYRGIVVVTGWNNVDRYVTESTIKRETLDYTDPETGRKAVIKYEKFSVDIADEKNYDAVFVYLIPNKLNSFMRMNKVENHYEEKLNELISYEMITVAYQRNLSFASELQTVKPGNFGSVKLTEISSEALSKKLRDIKGFSKEQTMRKELSYQLFAQQDRLRKKQFADNEKFTQRMMKTVFPCYEEAEETESDTTYTAVKTENREN